MIQVQDFQDVEGTLEVEGVTMRTVIGPDDGAPVFNMRVFEVEPGHVTPHHSHWWEHEVFILDGEGVAVQDSGETALSKGSVILVEGNEMHCFRNTGDSVLRFICLIPFQWLEGMAEAHAG